MTWIALKMLTGCRGKALGLIVGIAFASLLIAQQSSIFCGVMLSTTSRIRDVCDAEIWVMDPSVERAGPVKPLKDSDLYRVRSVQGVDWAHSRDARRVRLWSDDDEEVVGEHLAVYPCPRL